MPAPHTDCMLQNNELPEKTGLAHFLCQVGLRYFLINKNTASSVKIPAPGNNIP